ncbi:hypothetical protein BK127_19820 [Paenibacillus sp. FSL H7-0331]|nr:hypothetical protein BK127_19820 [Paenibacillus sp. FSL H7-0331]
MYEIIWSGNKYTNSSGRDGFVPFVIVNHISASTMSSMDSWFTSSGNAVSSAHFGVSRKGELHQYVEIERFAWANGTSLSYMSKYPAQVWIDQKYTNANYWTVSIEHEGTDGDLSEEQFQASVWLHQYIRDYIVDKWGQECYFPLDDYHVIGHFQLHSWKEFCPGIMFPWARLYETFQKETQFEEEDEMNKILDYDQWAWDELDKYLGDAYNDQTITDWKWVQAARDKTLVYKDLLLLKVLIDERRRDK